MNKTINKYACTEVNVNVLTLLSPSLRRARRHLANLFPEEQGLRHAGRNSKCRFSFQTCQRPLSFSFSAAKIHTCCVFYVRISEYFSFISLIRL